MIEQINYDKYTLNILNKIKSIRKKYDVTLFLSAFDLSNITYDKSQNMFFTSNILEFFICGIPIRIDSSVSNNHFKILQKLPEICFDEDIDIIIAKINKLQKLVPFI